MSLEAMQIDPNLQIILESMLTLSLLIMGISVATILVAQSVFAISSSESTSTFIIPGYKDNGTQLPLTTNMTFLGNMMPKKGMTMPGGNMTFGASLQNAKMHLTEAIMDLKSGNTKGAAMELNLTAQDIRMHEKELKIMMMQVKNMMTNMKESNNTTTSKNSTP